ncbi:uncharacterized protein [Montipora capricornis]|uniref:uncharacterized protein n=1 Tax=Montipora capricornis TaxID=246305 RepID=UPI0035F10585
MCRMCGEKPECLAHVLAGCSVLAQSRHNAALKIPFFEMLKDMDPIESKPPWYSPVQPKPVYENDKAEAYWNVPVYPESAVVKSNRVDLRIVDKEKKKVLLMEMTCPWFGNRGKKETEKTTKYAPLRWEMKEKYRGTWLNRSAS